MKIIRDIMLGVRPVIRYYWLMAIKPGFIRYCGIKIPLKSTQRIRHIRGAIFRSEYEKPELDIIKELLRPDDVVLEAGAGIGITTAAVALKLHNSNTLHCLEANHENIESIYAITNFNNIKPNVYQAALAKEDGTIDFYINSQFLSSSSMKRNDGGTKTLVKSISVNRILEEIQPTFFMIDIEGGEEILSEIEFPSSLRVICGEFHPHIIGDNKVNLIIKNIINQGFVMLLDQSKGRTLAFVRPGQ